MNNILKDRECTGCGCLFVPYDNRINNITDKRCPYCGGGRGHVVKIPAQRIKELQDKVESLEGDLETFAANALERMNDLQREIDKLRQRDADGPDWKDCSY